MLLPEAVAPQPTRHFSVNTSAFTPDLIAVEMIKYATSLAREQKTEFQKNHTHEDYWYWNSVSPLSPMIILRVSLNLLVLPYCLKEGLMRQPLKGLGNFKI